MLECSCAEFRALRPPAVATTKRLTHAVRNAVVHECDALRDQVTHLERELADLVTKRRHFVELTCERCRTSLTVGAAMEPSVGTLSAALRLLAIQERWTVSRSTAVELGMMVGEDRDLCSRCATVLMRGHRATEAP